MSKLDQESCIAAALNEEQLIQSSVSSPCGVHRATENGVECSLSEAARENAVSDDPSAAPLDLRELGTTRYRFVILFIFSFYGFINQIQYVGFAFVVRPTEDRYNVDALLVNVLSIVIPILYVIGVVPGCYLYNLVGFRYGAIIGISCNALAALLKFITVFTPQYALLIIGQIFVAAGQVMFLAIPTLMAALWFPDGERALATAVASLMGFAGMAVGMFYPPYVVTSPDRDSQKYWGALLGSQFAISVILLLLAVPLLRDAPRLRPSVTAPRYVRFELLHRLKKSFCSLNLLVLAGSFGLISGTLTAVAAVLPQILEPYGLDQNVCGILSFSGIMGGALNCALFGFLMDRFHQYKKALLGLSISVVVLLVPTVVMMKLADNGDVAVFAYIVIPVLECLVLPMVPVTMELAVELTYPEPEAVSTTLVLASMCLVSFIGMIVFSLVLGDYPTRNLAFIVVLIVLGVCALCVVGLFFVRETLYRTNKEVETWAVAHSETVHSEPLRSNDFDEEHNTPDYADEDEDESPENVDVTVK